MGNISVWENVMYMLPNLMGIFTTQEPTLMDSITGLTISFSSIAIESSVNIRKKKNKYDVCHLSNSCFYHSPDETYQKHVSEAHAEGPWLGCNFIFIALVSTVAGTPHSPESPSSFLPQTKSSCSRAALTVCFAESAE